ncbi:copper uptake system-associated protein [Aquamicrobium sp.]|uniref:copper uptake system-associated protein n=1 Tax=Aquamicrobium sp. TaxID=1872579 RepID=UPI00258B98D0|nr:copper uptake system-associated protein [Aquamicrobium sp.]MCK9550330.1 copper uptake system-associated protein [Aquamicrobium sp.]
MTKVGFLLIAILVTIQPVLAHEFRLNNLQIIHPAIPATSLNATSAPIYMVLANESDQAERLLAIETDFGTVTFQRPAIADDGTSRMEVVPHIDIPSGEIVHLARGEIRGVVDGLSRPIFEGGLLPAVLVFERRGRFEMFCMVDPPDDDENETLEDAANSGDRTDRAADLLAINTVLRAELGNKPDIVIAPVVLDGAFAVAGWTHGEAGARVLLRRDTNDGWYVEMWSGESLMLPATLSSIGVPRSAAETLRRELSASEALLGRPFTERFDNYPGTVVIGRNRSSFAIP